MRHFYFRFVLGIIWLLAAIVSGIGANIAFAVLYGILAILFLYSAYSIRRNSKDK